MSTNFILKGSRVLLNEPDFKKPAIELSPEALSEFEKEQMKKFNSLEVFAVGDKVDWIKPGDFVRVSPSVMAMSEVIEIDDNPKLMVREIDIDLVWK